ncbi:MAG: hypothetical protein H0T79_06435 [Deltaproteobacteria bacterium]|nr:hypothetical protein [Deltaproteobacteria bacterium]
MAQRIKLAGFEAALGLCVLGTFWLLGALGLVGGVILVVTQEVASSATVIGGLALLAAAVAVFGWTIVRGLRQFRVVVIGDDGAWRLLNPLGITIGRLAPDAPRSVDAKRRETWMFTGTAVKYTQGWVEIASGDRVWRSTRSTPKYQHAAIQTLTLGR